MKREAKRLTLSRKTLKTLQDHSLAAVAGGATVPYSNLTNCTACPSCPHVNCDSYLC
jgi:hypothetical protein